MDEENVQEAAGHMQRLMECLQHCHDNLHKQGYSKHGNKLTESGKRNSDGDDQCMHESHERLMEAGCKCDEAAQPPLPGQVKLADTPGEETHEAAQGPADGRIYESALREATFDAQRGELTLTVIHPGFNQTGSRFYTREACQSIAAGMRERKMYLNHATPGELRDRPERDLRDWTATIKETWQESDGTVKARAVIIDPGFLARVQRLSEAGMLGQLGASISAIGKGDEQVKEGRKTFVVDGIDQDDPFRSVDWVTEPGAGGRAELLESNRPLQEQTTMNEQQIQEKLDAQERQIATLTEALTGIRRGQTLDAILATIPVTEAAKSAARAQLLTGDGEITVPRVRETVQSVIASAATILGRETGVTGFGAEGEPLEESADAAEAELKRIFESYGLEGAALDAALHGR